MLKRKVGGDTQRAASLWIGVSYQHLNDVLSGKREPAGKILTALGLERVVSYRVKR